MFYYKYNFQNKQNDVQQISDAGLVLVVCAYFYIYAI